MGDLVGVYTTTHMKPESGWAVPEETVQKQPVLGHPPPHTAFRRVKSGLFVQCDIRTRKDSW